MVNESKKNDPRFWARWKASGAIAGVPELEMTQALKTPLEVIGVATTLVDGQPIRQTLSIGRKWTNDHTYGPVVAVVVPGDRFKPGDMVSRENLPKRTKPVGRFYE